jgi:transcriptional regulator
MFVPPVFAETDLSKLHQFILQNSFGLVVSQVDGLPFATHIPILLRHGEGQYGTLAGHVARANPQWRQLAGQTALAIFAGPHAYVSPTCYEAETVVPTWNYTAVHVYGRVELIDGGEPLLDILKESVRVYEHALPNLWVFESTGTFTERMMEQIVGFRVVIEKIEGKFKLNQNHPAERRHRVIRALEQKGDENSLGVVKLMRYSLLVEEKDSPVGIAYSIYLRCFVPPNVAS